MFAVMAAVPFAFMLREGLALHGFDSFNKTAAVAEGSVLRKTNGSVGQGRRQATEYFVSYRYAAPQGTAGSSGSYQRWARISPDDYERLDANQKIRVLYDATNPALARLEIENALPSTDGTGTNPAVLRFWLFTCGFVAAIMGFILLVMVVSSVVTRSDLAPK
jgi:hypothetical protein